MRGCCWQCLKTLKETEKTNAGTQSTTTTTLKLLSIAHEITTSHPQDIKHTDSWANGRSFILFIPKLFYSNWLSLQLIYSYLHDYYIILLFLFSMYTCVPVDVHFDVLKIANSFSLTSNCVPCLTMLLGKQSFFEIFTRVVRSEVFYYFCYHIIYLMHALVCHNQPSFLCSLLSLTLLDLGRLSVSEAKQLPSPIPEMIRSPQACQHGLFPFFEKFILYIYYNSATTVSQSQDRNHKCIQVR